MLHAIGCRVCYPLCLCSKLGQRGEIDYIVGVTGLTNTFHFYESDKQRVISHRDVKFWDEVFDYNGARLHSE
jgi:hypothetical protein